MEKIVPWTMEFSLTLRHTEYLSSYGFSCTITNEAVLSNIIRPSDTYLKTIALGLKETYNFDKQEIADYLIDKKGIKDSLKKDDLMKIFESLSALSGYQIAWYERLIKIT